MSQSTRFEELARAADRKGDRATASALWETAAHHAEADGVSSALYWAKAKEASRAAELTNAQHRAHAALRALRRALEDLTDAIGAAPARLDRPNARLAIGRARLEQDCVQREVEL